MSAITMILDANSWLEKGLMARREGWSRLDQVLRGLGAKNDAGDGRFMLASGGKTCVASPVLGLEFGAHPALAGWVNL
jgi:hypothetical protein